MWFTRFLATALTLARLEGDYPREDEHRRAVKQADFNSSALVGHAWTSNHAIDWTDVKVLANPRDYTTRMLEEAVFIHQTRDTLNRDCGTLPAEYENLFEKG